ncbi:MAG: putative cytokinetic ring protein SteA [Actinomycetota bacterium]|nr:putative cytokinetic ring protein SteA [Actinomycetota bacterium]
MATTSRRGFPRSLRPARNGRGGPSAIEGTARLGKRTKDLVKKLGSHDIAVIDHRNLDRIAAEELAACGVRAVINVSPSSDGSYPNAGPLTLVRAGVPLIDAPSPGLFDRIGDGDPITLEGGKVLARGVLLAEGRLLEADELARELDDQRHRIDSALHDFTENTMAHIREEGELLSGTIDFPETRTVFRDKHCLIVVRGTDHAKDLRALRAYIRDMRPVMIGVDGGADAIVKEGYKADVVLGDMDSARETTLRSGAELIVHAYSDGSAPGADRLVELGLDFLVVPAAGTSQDVAMLLASEKGASLIVSVGAHFNLVEFLDKQRSGMSSTFLTRLRIGETLVDAKGVSRLYNPGLSISHMALFFGAFAILLTIVVLTTPALENLAELLWLKIKVVLGL